MTNPLSDNGKWWIGNGPNPFESESTMIEWQGYANEDSMLASVHINYD